MNDWAARLMSVFPERNRDNLDEFILQVTNDQAEHMYFQKEFDADIECRPSFEQLSHDRIIHETSKNISVLKALENIVGDRMNGFNAFHAAMSKTSSSYELLENVEGTLKFGLDSMFVFAEQETLHFRQQVFLGDLRKSLVEMRVDAQRRVTDYQKEINNAEKEVLTAERKLSKSKEMLERGLDYKNKMESFELDVILNTSRLPFPGKKEHGKDRGNTGEDMIVRYEKEVKDDIRQLLRTIENRDQVLSASRRAFQKLHRECKKAAHITLQKISEKEKEHAEQRQIVVEKLAKAVSHVDIDQDESDFISAYAGSRGVLALSSQALSLLGDLVPMSMSHGTHHHNNNKSHSTGNNGAASMNNSSASPTLGQPGNSNSSSHTAMRQRTLSNDSASTVTSTNSMRSTNGKVNTSTHVLTGNATDLSSSGLTVSDATHSARTIETAPTSPVSFDNRDTTSNADTAHSVNDICDAEATSEFGNASNSNDDNNNNSSSSMSYRRRMSNRLMSLSIKPAHSIKSGSSGAAAVAVSNENGPASPTNPSNSDNNGSSPPPAVADVGTSAHTIAGDDDAAARGTGGGGGSGGGGGESISQSDFTAYLSQIFYTPGCSTSTVTATSARDGGRTGDNYTSAEAVEAILKDAIAGEEDDDDKAILGVTAPEGSGEVDDLNASQDESLLIDDDYFDAGVGTSTTIGKDEGGKSNLNNPTAVPVRASLSRDSPSNLSSEMSSPQPPHQSVPASSVNADASSIGIDSNTADNNASDTGRGINTRINKISLEDDQAVVEGQGREVQKLVNRRTRIGKSDLQYQTNSSRYKNRSAIEWLKSNPHSYLIESVDWMSKAIKTQSGRDAFTAELNQFRSRKVDIGGGFDALGAVLWTTLSYCQSENDIHNAKVIMMLSQTFFRPIVETSHNHQSSTGDGASAVANEGDEQSEQQSLSTADAHTINKEEEEEEEEGGDGSIGRGVENRQFIREYLLQHPIWKDGNYWEQALWQCAIEQLQTIPYEQAWHDMAIDERTEAVRRVHDVIFSQVMAITHSMLELGCSAEQTREFLYRMCVIHQLNESMRQHLLKHVTNTSVRKQQQQRRSLTATGSTTMSTTISSSTY